MLITLAAIGNAYPVIEHPFKGKGIQTDPLTNEKIPNPDGYFNKSCRKGYQSHYVVVRGGEPALVVKEGLFDEIAVFTSPQALPLFLVKLKVGLKEEEKEKGGDSSASLTATSSPSGQSATSAKN